MLAIGLLDLVETLSDQDCADAVAGHEGEAGLEEVEASERRKLVEHHQQLVAARPATGLIEALGQPAPDLIEDEPDERLGAADVGGRNDKVQRDRPFTLDEIRDAPVAARGYLGDGRIAVEAEERHGGRQHARALVVALVEELARGRRDDRMDLRRVGVAEVVGAHHALERLDEAALRIGKEGRDPGEGLVFIGIEDVENGADQQRVARLLPMVAAFERAFGIDQDVGDILDVAYLIGTAAHFEQRIVARRSRVGGIEQQAVREARAPTSCQCPILTFDVVDDGRTSPGQQGRHN